MKIALIILIVVVVIETLLILVVGKRIRHDRQKKRLRPNAYAIQNAGTGMDIRVYNVNVADGAKIILYPHHNWECLTWQRIERDDGSFLLKNLYTEKGFEAATTPGEGVGLWQQPPSAKDAQSWVFEETGDRYRIRLKGTEMYLAAKSDEVNADLILMPLSEDSKLIWTLIEQRPVV